MKTKVFLAALALSLGAQAQIREVVLKVSPLLHKNTVMKAQADGSVIINMPMVNNVHNGADRVTFESAAGICAAIQKKHVVAAQTDDTLADSLCHGDCKDDEEEYEQMSIVSKEGFIVGQKRSRYYLDYLICK